MKLLNVIIYNQAINLNIETVCHYTKLSIQEHIAKQNI
jgi:hypothetical protein